MDSSASLCVVLALVCGLLYSTHAQNLIENCTEFDVRPQDLIISPGGMACLDCAYGTRPPRWDANILGDQSFSAIVRDSEPEECDCTVASNGSLCFSNVDETVVHTYRCLVQFPNGPDSIICPFQVQLAVRPTINAPPTDVTVNAMGTAVLQVTFNPGTPAGVVSWSKDGNPVMLAGRVSQDDETGALTITDVAHTDRGVYTVTVTNTEGSDSADVNVFVNFVHVDLFRYEDTNGRMRVICNGLGYPAPTEVDLTASTSSTTANNQFEVVVNEVAMIASASDCLSQYRCTVTSGSRSTTMMLTPECSNSPTISAVTTVNFTAVRVTWENVGASSYEVHYGEELGTTNSVSVAGTSSTLIIGGLFADCLYTFQVVALYMNGQSPVASPNTTYTIQSCPGTFDEPVTGVSASIISNVNSKTTRLTWQAFNDADLASYRVTLDPCPRGFPCTTKLDRLTTSYDFPTSICDDEAYSFFVQAVNNCGGQGPRSARVTRTCDVIRNRITDLRPDAEAVTIKWDFDQLTPPLIISAKMLVPDSQNQLVMMNYSADASFLNLESACIQGLETDTTYEICLYPIFISEPARRDVHCDFVTTLSESQDDMNTIEGCLMAVTRTTDPVINTGSPSPPPGTIENWHIAIIVVGGLAIVAMVFCLVGLCFACQTSSKKVDFGSTSSLQTNSIRDGVTPMSHQRSMSPSRSCLSYHTKGHSTNWSDHVDTLRQMETDTGTHV